ncbi:transcription termination factor, mitochondrial isoform X2 [Neodiprion virginianus]|uniref:transcription termination factor, mitochondrial isoform X2 n=1 Tax=Neodiprion virginianus TaxID=2961670 RepID=UPI001EE7431D|nr:transcription termination factor, mitochondrial isoform X2 [Neodiprion virginianus]
MIATPTFLILNAEQLTRSEPQAASRNYSALILKRLIFGSKLIEVLVSSIQLIYRLIIKHAWTLTYLRQLSEKMHGIFRLLALSKQLIYDVRWYGASNRIQYLAEQLQCSMFEVCQLIVKYQFMQNHPFDKLRDTLKILLHYRIEREAIMNDCWAFRQNPETIIDRLERIREAGIFPVKPWMVRCIEPVIARRINKESHRRAILGENGTIIYYLSERFQCDENKVAVILSKLPQIKHVSGPKTKKVVDFLIENEYTIEHVIRVPRILFHGVEKAQKRLNELLEYGHKPKSLIVFCKTEKEYNEYLKRIKKKWLKNEKK